MFPNTRKALMSDVCQFVADWDNFLHEPIPPRTADDIFNYSPTGELFKIWEWWETALNDTEFMATQNVDELTRKGIITDIPNSAMPDESYYLKKKGGGDGR